MILKTHRLKIYFKLSKKLKGKYSKQEFGSKFSPKWYNITGTICFFFSYSLSAANILCLISEVWVNYIKWLCINFIRNLLQVVSFYTILRIWKNLESCILNHWRLRVHFVGHIFRIHCHVTVCSRFLLGISCWLCLFLFLSSLENFVKLCICVSLGVCACECKYLQRPEEGITYPRDTHRVLSLLTKYPIISTLSLWFHRYFIIFKIAFALWLPLHKWDTKCISFFSFSIIQVLIRLNKSYLFSSFLLKIYFFRHYTLFTFSPSPSPSRFSHLPSICLFKTNKNKADI